MKERAFNALFIPSYTCSIDAMANIMKKGLIDKLYVLLSGRLRDRYNDSGLVPDTEAIIDYEKSRKADYTSSIYYDRQIPLDSETIRKMRPYESEIIKMCERNIEVYYSIEKRFMYYYKHLKYWFSFIKNSGISIVLCGGHIPHNVPEYVLYRLCRMLGIQFYMFEVLPFRTKTRIILINDFERFDESIERRLEENKDNREIVLPADLEDEYLLFKGSNKQLFPSRKPRINVKKMISNIAITPSNALKIKYRGYIKGKLNEIRYRIVTSRLSIYRVAMLAFYEKHSISPDYSAKYVYFPLQYQPELTTCPMGGMFVHLYLAIEMIASSLPEGYLVYVKEHPVIRDIPGTSREICHYSRLLEIKNVRLIKIESSTTQLIDKSVAVASITSSVGYEAMYAGKPYLMFGYQIMRYAPNTYNVRTVEDCKKALEDIFSGGFNTSDHMIRVFLKTIGDVSFIIDINSSFSRDWADTKDNVELLCDLFMNKIIKVKNERVI